MVDLIARPVADAFLQVTVFVAVMIGIFGYLQHRFGDRLTRFLLSHWRAGPLLGAVLGVVPGCGGAIVVMPMYVRGRVSFGTVVAALVATMGDSSFVIIAADPRLAAILHATLFVCGVLSGYAVDATGFAPRARQDAFTVPPPEVPPSGRRSGPSGPATDGASGAAAPVTAAARAVVAEVPADGIVLGDIHAAGGTASIVSGSPSTLPRFLTTPVSAGVGPTVFWVMVLLGAVVVTPVVLQVSAATDLPRVLGVIDPFMTVGLAGTLVAAALTFTGRRRERCRDADAEAGTLPEVFRETAYETARITVWVAAAFLAVEAVAELGFTVVAIASVAGIGGVVVGAAIGLIPGCAPQIVLTGLYASGVVPFATLLANALSQDGDALLPMLLMDRRGAVVASLITTIPGLLAGGAVLAATAW